MDRAELTICRGGVETTLPFSGVFVVGSAPDADLVLTVPSVSAGPGVHLRIVSTDEGAEAVPGAAGALAARVNGHALERATRLRSGDEVEIGEARLVFRAPGERPATGTLKRRLAPPGEGAGTPAGRKHLSISDSQELSWFSGRGVLDRSLCALHEAAKLFASTSGETVLLERTIDVAMTWLLADGGAVVARGARGELVELCARGSGPAVRLSEEELLRALRDGVSSCFQATDGSSYLVVPVMRTGGKPEGALWFRRPAGGVEFVREELDLATSLGRQLAAALDGARLVKGLQQRTTELERLRGRLEAILTTISEGLVVVTGDGRAAPLSPRGRELLLRAGGWNPADGQLGAGSPLTPLVLAAQQGERVERQDVERGADLLEVSASRVAALDAVVLVLRDAAEERRRERQHQRTERRLRREVLEISAREQRRIGQDLHDGLCQTLVAVGLLAEGLSERLSKGALEDEAATAARIAAHLQEAAGSARDLARGLNPVALEEFGLVAALTELAQATQRLASVPCTFSGEQVRVKDPAIAVNLYYIAREAVNNAVKHGEPTRIAIALRRRRGARGDEVLLEVDDDGAGLPDAEATPRSFGGMGMHIMAHRAHSIDADLKLEPRPGGGTIVRCTLPAAVVEGRA